MNKNNPASQLSLKRWTKPEWQKGSKKRKEHMAKMNKLSWIARKSRKQAEKLLTPQLVFVSGIDYSFCIEKVACKINTMYKVKKDRAWEWEIVGFTIILMVLIAISRKSKMNG